MVMASLSGGFTKPGEFFTRRDEIAERRLRRGSTLSEYARPAKIAFRSIIMKSYTEHLTMNVPKRMGFVNITPQVEAAVKTSGVQEGMVLCNTRHHWDALGHFDPQG